MKRLHRSARGVTALLVLVLTACVGGQARGADGEGDGEKPAPRPPTVAEVFKDVKDSVVEIHTIERQVVETRAGKTMTSVGGLGSGVLIRVPVEKDGRKVQALRVLTAAHVVQAADRIEVTFMSGESIAARVAASEPSADLALLQLERPPAVAQVAALGDSGRVEVGDQVFVVGAPFGVTHSLTVGHISARRQEASGQNIVEESEPILDLIHRGRGDADVHGLELTDKRPPGVDIAAHLGEAEGHGEIRLDARTVDRAGIGIEPGRDVDRHHLGELPGQTLEVVGPGHEIGLAVELDDATRRARQRDPHRALPGLPSRALTRP